MKISFIGLGAMGYPMARHLKNDHDVAVWNRTAPVAEKHGREHGTRVARELASCADAEVILTILPTGREVDEIADHLIDHLRPGILWIDATSGDPEMSRATAERLRKKGIEFVDAPVSGGPVGAEAGTLTVMVGGSPENFTRAEAILRSCAKKIIHVGEIGAGHAIKVLTNVIMATNVWISAECILSMKKLGIDVRRAMEVVNATAGRSNATENLLPLRLVEGQWPLLFKLALHEKDIRIAEKIVQEQRLSTPLLALTSQLFTAALNDLGRDADYIEVAKYVAKMSGEEW
ncbi:MAG TPA: NAD(P)-dependent oxidoreductase [Thermoanaerobaculia bacterium]